MSAAMTPSFPAPLVDGRPLRVGALAASNRRGSHNRRLLRVAMGALADIGAETDHLDLRGYPLPLYDADLQERDGVPAGAVELRARIGAVDALLIASPEYNGGYAPLLKNTIDWVSRVDMFTFHPKYTGLLSTSPGKTGGARGLDHLADLFTNIFVTTHPERFTLPAGHTRLADDGFVEPADAEALSAWVRSFAAAAADHAQAVLDRTRDG